MAQQSSREFASTDPTTRMQDAAFQMSGVSPKISLNSRSHLQPFQRPTSSHFCKDAPSLSRVGYEHVARGSRGRLKIFGTENSRVLLSTLPRCGPLRGKQSSIPAMVSIFEAS